MALTIQNWARSSVSGNEPIYTLADASITGCFREYNYYTADTQATVAASGYFNAGVTGGGVAYDLVTGDSVKVYSTTDGTWATYRITNTAGVITSSVVASNVRAATSLTAVQLIAGYAAPILMLAAPGANRMYTDVSAQFVFTYGSAQFTTGGNLGIQYGSTANLGGTKCTSVLTNTQVNGIAASSIGAVIPVTVAPTASASIANTALYLSNDTAAFAVGTGTTILVNVNARIVPTA